MTCCRRCSWWWHAASMTTRDSAKATSRSCDASAPCRWRCGPRDSEAAAPDVIVLTAKDELLENWLDEIDAVAAVVRPDRYVYGVAHDRLELRRLLAQLDSTLQIRPIDRFRGTHTSL